MRFCMTVRWWVYAQAGFFFKKLSFIIVMIAIMMINGWRYENDFVVNENENFSLVTL